MNVIADVGITNSTAAARRSIGTPYSSDARTHHSLGLLVDTTSYRETADRRR
jgi:hypothetical protein